MSKDKSRSCSAVLATKTAGIFCSKTFIAPFSSVAELPAPGRRSSPSIVECWLYGSRHSAGYLPPTPVVVDTRSAAAWWVAGAALLAAAALLLGAALRRRLLRQDYHKRVLDFWFNNRWVLPQTMLLHSYTTHSYYVAIRCCRRDVLIFLGIFCYLKVT